jgi:ParB family chromosome partitioning protein
MSESAPPPIVTVPIAEIEVINPRQRSRKIFETVVGSIADIGLKRPIVVSLKPEGGYQLVCGQGRIEAFRELGQSEIPAIVIDASTEESYVMSLVENIARKPPSPLDLMRAIGSLRDRGHSQAAIARKIGFSSEYVWAICFLIDHGEERLLAAVERGIVPHTTAIEIARADDQAVQAALTEAYEQKLLPGAQILAIRQIVTERNMSGRGLHTLNRNQQPSRPTASGLVKAYQRETQRQRLLVMKATLAQTRLVFIVGAMKSLLADEHFTTLLRAETLSDMPMPLAERLHAAED